MQSKGPGGSDGRVCLQCEPIQPCPLAGEDAPNLLPLSSVSLEGPSQAPWGQGSSGVGFPGPPRLSLPLPLVLSTLLAVLVPASHPVHHLMHRGGVRGGARAPPPPPPFGGGEWRGERAETEPVSAPRGWALVLPLCKVRAFLFPQGALTGGVVGIQWGRGEGSSIADKAWDGSAPPPE